MKKLKSYLIKLDSVWRREINTLTKYFIIFTRIAYCKIHSQLACFSFLYDHRSVTSNSLFFILFLKEALFNQQIKYNELYNRLKIII